MTISPVGQSRRAAFTLIELLTVITIILILAGLILGIAGNAQNKAARSRAEGEIKAMETACNSYQIDNGVYPREPVSDGTGATDVLDPKVDLDPASGSKYKAASLILYRLVSGAYYIANNGSTSSIKLWSSNDGVPKPTVYMPFKASQLQNKTNITSGFVDPGDVTAIIDPFGFSYGYSTAYQADVEKNSTQTPPTLPTRGYNPTYDLWSTAGYSTSSGKAFPTPVPADRSTLWVKNW